MAKAEEMKAAALQKQKSAKLRLAELKKELGISDDQPQCDNTGTVPASDSATLIDLTGDSNTGPEIILVIYRGRAGIVHMDSTGVIT